MRAITAAQRRIWRERGRFYVTPTRPHLPDRDEYSVTQYSDPAFWDVLPERLAVFLPEAEAWALWRRLTDDAEYRRECGLAE